MLAVFTIVAAGFCLLAANPRDSVPPDGYDVVEAYRIYDVVLSHAATNTALVIQEETEATVAVSEWCLSAEAKQEFKTSIEDYARANERPRRLQQQLRIDQPYQLVSSDTIKSILAGTDWAGFKQRYPGSGGYFAMSAVGFNADKTHAIASSAYVCGGRCGHAGLHLLKKFEGNWKLVAGTASRVKCSIVF
jgi:hypothetical protein